MSWFRIKKGYLAVSGRNLLKKRHEISAVEPPFVSREVFQGHHDLVELGKQLDHSAEEKNILSNVYR